MLLRRLALRLGLVLLHGRALLRGLVLLLRRWALLWGLMLLCGWALGLALMLLHRYLLLQGSVLHRARRLALRLGTCMTGTAPRVIVRDGTLRSRSRCVLLTTGRTIA